MNLCFWFGEKDCCSSSSSSSFWWWNQLLQIHWSCLIIFLFRGAYFFKINFGFTKQILVKRQAWPNAGAFSCLWLTGADFTPLIFPCWNLRLQNDRQLYVNYDWEKLLNAHSFNKCTQLKGEEPVLQHRLIDACKQNYLRSKKKISWAGYKSTHLVNNDTYIYWLITSRSFCASMPGSEVSWGLNHWNLWIYSVLFLKPG